MIEVISDIIVGLSAVVVAVFAALGLNAWRRELTGKAKFELAKRLVFLAIKLKAGFGWARRWDTYSGEYASRERRRDESQEESRVLDEWYARERRLERLRPDLAELEQAGWEAEILLEEDKSKQVQEVVRVFREAWAELDTAVYEYFDNEHREACGSLMFENREQHREWLKGLRHIIYGINDGFSKKLDDAVERLKEVLRGYVR